MYTIYPDSVHHTIFESFEQDIVYSNVYQHISSLFHASAFVFNGIKSINFEITKSLQKQKIISLSMVQFEFWF